MFFNIGGALCARESSVALFSPSHHCNSKCMTAASPLQQGQKTKHNLQRLSQLVGDRHFVPTSQNRAKTSFEMWLFYATATSTFQDRQMSTPIERMHEYEPWSKLFRITSRFLWDATRFCIRSSDHSSDGRILVWPTLCRPCAAPFLQCLGPGQHGGCRKRGLPQTKLQYTRILIPGRAPDFWNPLT